MKFLLALFISYSCLSYGDDKSIPKAMIKDVDDILKQAPTLGLAPIGLCDSITPAADFVECSKAIEHNEAIKKNFGKREFDQLETLVRSCFQKRFEKCYPNLKKNIEHEQVKNLFNEWKKDPRFRYPSGAGMCHYRAETLSYHLAELGYETTTIRIEHSPTLIVLYEFFKFLISATYSEGMPLLEILGNKFTQVFITESFYNISIPPKLARDIADALNQLESKAHITTKRQIEVYKLEEFKLQNQEDELLDLRLSKSIDQETYDNKLKKIRIERRNRTDQIESLQLSLTSAVVETMNRFSNYPIMRNHYGIFSLPLRRRKS